MKQKIFINHSESKNEQNTYKKIEFKKLNLDLLYNKFLNNKNASIIVNKEYLSNKKGNHLHLIKKEKQPILWTNNSNNRKNSSSLKMNLSPRRILSPNDANNKLKKNVLFKHKNFYGINISDNSYNFHQHKKIIDEDKKLFIYFNKNINKEKNIEKNEEEKCPSSPKINKETEKENKQKDNSLCKDFSSQTTTNFYKKPIEKLDVKPIQEKHILNLKKEDNKNKGVMLHSQSMKNTTKSFFDKKRELNFIKSQIKEEVRNYFIKYKFSSIKDYFNDWLYFKRKQDYQKKLSLDEDDIYYYLKEKIGVKIFKDEIGKIFKCKKIVFDINMFKNIFFEEDSGKKNLYINDVFTKYNIFNKLKHKENNKLFCFSDIFKNNKYNIPIFKNNLLISALKERKSKIINQICNNFIENNRKIEYDYFEFYNLFQDLNIDKKIVNYKSIKKVFNKYKNENDKVNIKYFIDNLYKNDSIKDELFHEKNENKKNIMEQLTNPNYYKSNPIYLHINKIELNKNDNVNDKLQQSSPNEIERYTYKTHSIYIKKNTNNNNNSSNLSRLIKFSDSQIKKKLKKKKIFTIYEPSTKINNIANTARESKQKFWRLNSYKTIRIRKQSQTNSSIKTYYNMQKSNSKDKNISSFSKCIFGVNNNNYKNYSNFMSNETMKILSEESRIQKMNSDIINLI